MLDLRLPKVDGKEVLRQIKADDRLKAIPVVVLTSSREDRDINECYNLGANSFVVKPVEFDNFAETVARLGYSLGGNQYVDLTRLTPRDGTGLKHV